MGSFVGDLATAFVPTAFADEKIRDRLSADHYLRRDPGRMGLAAAVGLELRSGFGREALVDFDGTPLDSFSLLLNTVLAIGNDPTCLAARIHGSCEIHCYVEGANRAWLADLVDQGRHSGLYRERAGWEELTELLRSRDDEPVVSDYSVTDGFPHCPSSWTPAQHNEDGEPDWDTWYDLSDQERWELALADIRAVPERGLELCPNNLRLPYDHARSLIDLFVQAPGAGLPLPS